MISAAISPSRQPLHQLRVMHYNVYAGGNRRLSRILQAVRAARPDVLGILEAVNWQRDRKKRFVLFSHRAGFRYRLFSPSNTRHHLALFSRLPLGEHAAVRQGFRHSLIQAAIPVRGFGDITLFLVHFDPRGEDERLRELERVVARARRVRHAVIFGDLNALSPHDPYPKGAARELLARGIKKFGTRGLRFDCVRSLEAAGFIDAARIVGMPFTATVPTPMNRDPMHAAPLRLDYAFVSRSLAPYVQDARVIRNRVTRQASDHYPLLVEFGKP